jgi:hypothetical protein
MILTVLVGVVSAVLLGAALGGLALLRRPARRSVTVHPGVTSVRVRLGAGRVELADGDRAEARLESVWWPRPGGGGPVVTLAGGLLDVDARRCRARVQARLPRGAAVRAEVREGEITLWGSAGDLALVTGTGMIAGRELSGRRVAARSGSGDVVLVFDAPPAEAVAMSDTGDVRVVLPPADYQVDAAAADPSRAAVDPGLNAGGPGDSGGAAARVTARTRTGAVYVTAASPLGPARL